MNKKKIFSFELVLGLIFLITEFVAYFLKFKTMIYFTSVMLQIILLVFLISNIKKTVYWKNKPILSVLSILYKMMVYTSMLWVFANLPLKVEISLISIILCISYMIFAYFNQSQYKEIFNAFIYWQAINTLFWLLYPHVH
jgi:hypothetical protein